MTSHNMLIKRALLGADMDHAGKVAMSNSNKDQTAKSGVSLFRPGQPSARLPVTLDQRTGHEIFAVPRTLAAISPARVWDSLGPIAFDAERLAGNGLFTQSSTNPAVTAFDMLRTRLLQALAERNWRRLAVTSPTHGCGKSFVAANLALSLARLTATRTILVDLELRRPHLADIFGVKDVAPIAEFLSGDQPLESHFRRFGRNLALGLNGTPVPDAATLLQDPDTTEALDAMTAQLQPDAVIYDLPPALVSDDVVAMIPHIDAVLLVVDGTRSTAADIRATERLFDGKVPLMGVVLNKAQDRGLGHHAYGKR
jgi:protein-tyrosine kinase